MGGRRIALVGGYTAGHVLPMVTVAAAYRLKHPDAKILFLGSADGPEANILARHGYTPIDGAPLYGATGLGGRLRAYGLVCKSLLPVRRLLAEAEIELVLGFGGYITAAPLLAARSLGLSTALFEANAKPGRANRLLCRTAELLLAAHPETTAHPAWRRASVTDYPVRREILALAAEPHAAKQGGPLRILVTAGSRGSPFLNAACPSLMTSLRRRGVDVAVHHQSGPGDVAAIEAAYRAGGVPALVESFVGDMADAYRRADFVICGGGAGSLAEVTALSLPSLVVPIAAVADDHQSANAEALARLSTGIRVVAEKEWDLEGVTGLVAERLAAKAQISFRPPRAASRARDAAASIVEACERLIARKRWRGAALRLMGGPGESASS